MSNLDHPSVVPIWAPWPVFGAEETRAVSEVLVSGRVNYWTGPHGREFEREYAEAVGGQRHRRPGTGPGGDRDRLW